MAGFLGTSGCSTDRDVAELFGPDESGVLVVDAVLLVGRPFPIVLLTRTARPDQLYEITAAVEGGAQVTITGGDQVVSYRSHSELPGLYYPILLDPPASGVVEPNTTYRLRVETTRDEVVTATTTTPESFAIDEWVILDDDDLSVMQRFEGYAAAGDSIYARNQVIYSRGLLQANFRRPEVPAFQVGIFSLDEGSPYAIDPDFFDDEDFEDLDRVESSPPFEARDGLLRLPWFAIYFEGRYQMKVYALDRNWYDLVRSVPELGGGGPGFGGTAGDDFDDPIFHVEGGIGLFGSAAVDSIGFFVLPRE